MLSTLALSESTSLNAISGLALSEVTSLNAVSKFAAKSRGVEIVESDSETDTDEQIVAICDSALGYDPDLPFYWECLHVEDDGSELIDEFDWEDVSGRVGEREIFSAMPLADDNNVENTNLSTEEEDETEMNVDWEVLLSVNYNDVESVLVEDQEGFEYEDLFGQFGDHGGSDWTKCGRPAASSVVENLPSVQLTEDDLAKENILCAVCKDEISISDEVKGLPCLHYYHKCCIVPWLVVRNTCPLCRYELPSSDSNDATTIDGEEEAQTRYEFEILQAT
ncbi:E3 ubiquitin-protein ligase RING1-like [Platanthera zijinensis]|uniref:E3 ubiquitin-protein ligase RING1-like n=1 Tax=Platanthera zijinensis TaxID=2320716 RepID=A0AAP0BS90_9ASPA